MWCQLFSEPGAGSDLAALRTRAEQKGNKWVVNGQKIWTSGAQFSHYGLLLARTDPTLPKHKGMTMFIMSMKTPGMEVRPIKQMSGSSSFNEVFMTNCEVADEQRVGKIGDGWNVATGLLGRERSAPLSRRPDIIELLEFVDAIEAEGAAVLGDDAVRDKMAELYVRSEAIRLTRLRAMTALSKGKAPGPEGSIVKLADTLRLQDMASYAIDLLGPAGTLYKSAEPIKSLFEDAFFYSAGLRLAGGTDEIQRNVIAERVLKLPPDIRIDKNIPFKDVPTGSRN
jgi:alkylation response protein AidB-like acyl-CoA dehydrogenase